MARFVNVPELTIGDYGQWILAGELRYESDILPVPVVVPEGFETDLASIPAWVPRWLADPNGHSRLAAIVHDFLCKQEVVYRPTADRVFLEAMLVAEVPKWRAYMMYAAVRVLTFWLKVTRRRSNGDK